MDTPGKLETRFCYPLDYIVDNYHNEIKIAFYVLTASFIACLITGTLLMIYDDKKIAFPILIYGMLGMLYVVSLYIFKLFVWLGGF
jgi:hypothetical protein